LDEFPQIAAQIAARDGQPPVFAESSDTTAAPHVGEMPSLLDVGPGAAADVPMPHGTLTMLDVHGDVRPLEEIEAETIRFAIAHYRGQMSEVARRLQIGRSTLYRKLEHLRFADRHAQDEPAEAN